MTELTGAQVRMARAALRWSAAELAEMAGVGISTVQRIETVDGVPTVAGDPETPSRLQAFRAGERSKAISAIVKAFTAAGVTFLSDDGKGVGIRVKPKASKWRR